ncbi:aldehyde dehydrogenase family protein [Lysinibacillus endophyticus]|uniref:aldehyde dehydrogenase family protein n=1 Tax=Ureibacillus endophyticus TaxID=1978490 RepID=UPI00209C8232|nr:aldehyde dehydrogenase family protein [Lysinibacillus endophyticus]MCP1146773.1 aldehyde dehydrogenase family protein [Lysinibacillus endophyticus]
METTRIWINGQWESTEKTYELYSPYDGKLLANIAKASKDDVNRAIEVAHQTFQTFKKTSAYERAQILYKVVNILERRKQEMVSILVKEAGKPYKAALAEAERTISTYLFAAEGAKQPSGETVPLDAAPTGKGYMGYTKRVPLGVVSAITPFNFPFNLVAHKLGPAFAVGNTVVLKPANQTPLSALFMAEVFKEAGLPDGVLQIVTGSGSELSESLITHEYVKKVTFTGSEKVGLAIKEKVGLRKLTLELGSNSALIVEPGTPIQQVISRIVNSAFNFAGQVCISLQRIYVHESIYQEFVQSFVDETNKLVIGDPANEMTDVSAMIHPTEVQRLKEWLNEAIKMGAEVATGGTFTERIMAPTVVLNASSQMKIVCQETFAPIVSIIPYKNLEDAINMVNESKYGLNVGIYTQSLSDALLVSDEIETGSLIINDIPSFRVDNMPYGGVKQSGYGREGIKFAIEEMTDLRFIAMKKTIG